MQITKYDLLAEAELLSRLKRTRLRGFDRAEVYRDALPLVERIYLTELQADFEGDVWFPALAAGQWRAGEREHHPVDGERPAWDFVICDRIP